MSIFDLATATCGTCGATSEFDAVLSVNADRRPDLREQILDGTFQTTECPGCGDPVRLPPAFTYLELGRGHWMAVHPPGEDLAWQAREAAAVEAFDDAFGPGAPPAAQELGRGVTPRVVFGWTALQEKLLAKELGLDDAVLELLKLALLHDVAGLTVEADSELRLAGGNEDTLAFDWLRAETSDVRTRFQVPRAAYDAIVDDPGPWSDMRGRAAGPAFVDLRRALLDGTAPMEATMETGG